MKLVKEYDFVNSSGRKIKVVDLICDCGEVVIARPRYLAAKFKSCAACSKPNLKHGRARDNVFDITYSSWENMKARCKNRTNPYYHKYGGAGITVSSDWNSFDGFLKDMGERPSKLHTIERIDNELGYFKDNCRWATRKEQSRNRRCTKLYEVNGKSLNLSEAAEELGICLGTFYYYTRKGKTVEEVIADRLTRSV